MKTTILATVSALGIFAGSIAGANDFNTVEATLSAQYGMFNFTVEGTGNNGYQNFTIGADVLSFDLASNVNSAVNVFGSYHRGDEFSLGTVASVVYDLGAVDVYGLGRLEYFTTAQSLMITPTAGVNYTINSTFDAFAEVGYTWNASNNWSRMGGVAEVGVNVNLADNVTLTPSIRHRFDANGVANNTQAHVGVAFSF
jgi:hypothetical protein